MTEGTQRLFMELRIGEALMIDGATVTLEQKSGQRARLRIEHVGSKVERYEGPERRKQPRAGDTKTV